MKQELAPEALYHPKSLVTPKESFWEEAAERIRVIDPDGKRALELFRAVGENIKDKAEH